MRWLVVVGLVACKHGAKPLPEGLLGEWESWCVSERDTSECLSKEREGSRMTLAADGTLAIKGESDLHGHWKLAGDQLEMSIDVAGQHMGTRFRARIQDDRLVLWSGDHSEIYGRVGAAFEPADSPTTTGDPVVRTLKGVTYTLPLPRGYRLGEASEHEETWMPAKGDGFTVSIKISDRGQTSRPDGSMGTPTCKEFGGGRGGGSVTTKGVEHERYYDIMTCLEGTSLYAQCSVEHTRGYLEKSEAEAAYALCTPLKLAP